MIIVFLIHVARFVPDLGSPGARYVLGATIILATLALSGLGLRIMEWFLVATDTPSVDAADERRAATDRHHPDSTVRW